MDIHQQALQIVSQMILEEKASLCSGRDAWHLKFIDRLGLPSIMVADGPHGLRKQTSSGDFLAEKSTVPAVCFPTASATACSFDRNLLRSMGVAIGEECRQEEVAVILGPGINIKRSPLCGRNFEYFSEDPMLSGELASAFIEGVQSQGVGTSLKHFAANNQEKRRMVIDAVMDERTFREIYMRGFEIAVKKAKPWTVMCAYNRLFGEFASQYRRLLTGILREEWGFDGLVVSDWGATVDRVKGLAAGLDLEMPFTGPENDLRIAAAVRNGQLDVADLDRAAVRLVELILRAQAREPMTYDLAAHRDLAKQIAIQSAVLLKNDDGILPGKASAHAAVIGALAKTPRYQGTGSSKIVPIHVDAPWDALQALGLTADYAPGYRMDSDEVDGQLLDEACRVAAGKDVVYLFAGLPDSYEAETFDRDHMRMPDSHLALIDAICLVNPNVVVILQGGAPMELPWFERIKAVLMMYLAGEAGGTACAELLLGLANPSGKLAESWPLTLQDNPSHGYFPGYGQTVEYREGLFVGYRFYDTARVPVRFPFGFGLSYTEYAYSDLQVTMPRDGEGLIRITCTIKNMGTRAGREVVQLYCAHRSSKIIRAEQELHGFTKVALMPSEQASIELTLKVSDLAFYDTETASWLVEEGDYELRIGASSRDIRLKQTVSIQGVSPERLQEQRRLLPAYAQPARGMPVNDRQFELLIGRPLPARERVEGSPHTVNSTFGEIQDRFSGNILLSIMRRVLDKMGKEDPELQKTAERIMMDSPLRQMTMFESTGMTIRTVEGIVDILNGHVIAGLRKILSGSK
jgi:beta-glucosidase